MFRKTCRWLLVKRKNGIFNNHNEHRQIKKHFFCDLTDCCKSCLWFYDFFGSHCNQNKFFASFETNYHFERTISSRFVFFKSPSFGQLVLSLKSLPPQWGAHSIGKQCFRKTICTDNTEITDCIELYDVAVPSFSSWCNSWGLPLTIKKIECFEIFL